MTSFKYYFFFLTILVFVSCRQDNSISTGETTDSNQLTNHNASLQEKGDNVIWMTPKQFTPISFLNAVVRKNDKDTLINVITMVDDFPIDWVKKSDIDTLMTLIKSTKRCNCFLNPLSSYIPTNISADIGGYAIIFVNSFRQKTKIKMGLYSCPKTEKQSVEKLTKWWENYNKKK
ncbi:MAG: hypothetical protein HXX18_11275 [Bacteroidetes bacterium]|nr:hypothetical protein [Bacteroidota bacterium]